MKPFKLAVTKLCVSVPDKFKMYYRLYMPMQVAIHTRTLASNATWKESHLPTKNANSLMMSENIVHFIKLAVS